LFSDLRFIGKKQTLKVDLIKLVASDKQKTRKLEIRIFGILNIFLT